VDKGTQEEMGRLEKFTKQQRHEYIDRMIASRLNGSTVIRSYLRMPAGPLPPIPEGKWKGLTLHELLIMQNEVWLDEREAEHLFTHAVAIITGATKPDDPRVFQGIQSIDEAYDLLWIAFNQMRPDIETRESIFTDTGKRLSDLERAIADLSKRSDNRDTKTEEALKLLLQWQKKHDELHAKSVFMATGK
jgi:hypothetical protein